VLSGAERLPEIKESKSLNADSQRSRGAEKNSVKGAGFGLALARIEAMPAQKRKTREIAIDLKPID
jgi:hypothetical protein